MKSTTAVLSAVALFTSFVSASPTDIQARSTSANFSNFTVSCGSSTCSYSTNVVLVPDNVPVSYTLSTTGSTVPANSGFWTSSNPNVFLHFNKLPAPINAYRIVLTDARVPGSSTNFAYNSPVSDWPGADSYTGPSSFTAS